jgi:asparagine synthase (glutamine-hydrolysing)
MDKNTVQRIISEHLSGEKNRRLFIWSLLCFEEWCKIYG